MGAPATLGTTVSSMLHHHLTGKHLAPESYRAVDFTRFEWWQERARKDRDELLGHLQESENLLSVLEGQLQVCQPPNINPSVRQPPNKECRLVQVKWTRERERESAKESERARGRVRESERSSPCLTTFRGCEGTSCWGTSKSRRTFSRPSRDSSRYVNIPRKVNARVIQYNPV